MDDSDSGQDFTADLVLETTTTRVGKIVLNGTDADSNNANDDVQLEDASGNIEEKVKRLQHLQVQKKMFHYLNYQKKL